MYICVYFYSIAPYRNKHVQTAKNVLKGIGAGAATGANVAVVVVTGGKINPKK